MKTATAIEFHLRGGVVVVFAVQDLIEIRTYAVKQDSGVRFQYINNLARAVTFAFVGISDFVRTLETHAQQRATRVIPHG